MFTFADALAMLKQGNAVMRIAREARPAANYRWSEVLPELPRPNYRARSAAMRIRATMAGMVGMSSPYPTSGAADSSTFDEATVKLANEVPMEEETIRQIQELVQQAIIARVTGFGGAGDNMVVLNEVTNFLRKVVIQAHLDTAEWMRGRALATGQIDWTFNGIPCKIDYGVPSGNFLTLRTGNDAYDGSSSKFWDDIRALKAKLNYDVAAFYAHPDTIDVILGNSANNLVVTEQNPLTRAVTLRRYVSILGTTAVSTDARDTVTLIPHSDSGEVYDLTLAGKQRTTKQVPFCPKGVIVAIGRAVANQWIVGAGSTPSPIPVQLGYTHLGPTVESMSLQPGRWADMYVPQGQQWQIIGQGASNLMPVIEDPTRIAVASTEMP